MRLGVGTFLGSCSITPSHSAVADSTKIKTAHSNSLSPKNSRVFTLAMFFKAPWEGFQESMTNSLDAFYNGTWLPTWWAKSNRRPLRENFNSLFSQGRRQQIAVVLLVAVSWKTLHFHSQRPAAMIFHQSQQRKNCPKETGSKLLPCFLQANLPEAEPSSKRRKTSKLWEEVPMLIITPH